MNLGHLIMRAAFLAAQAGFKDTVVMPDWPSLINSAYQDFAWETEFNDEETTLSSVVNQAEYLLDESDSPRYFRFIKQVAYGTNRILRFTTETEEEMMDPLWFTRGMGTPTRFLVPRMNVIRLIDKPGTANVLIIVRGIREPLALTHNTDSPLLPDTYMEAICLKAAHMQCEAWVGEVDFARLGNYLNQYKQMCKDLKSDLNMERFNTIPRVLRRPNRGRVFASGFPRYG